MCTGAKPVSSKTKKEKEERTGQLYQVSNSIDGHNFPLASGVGEI